MPSSNSFLAAESFRQVLSQGPYKKIDRLISIVERESPALPESLIRDARLRSPGLLELPPFFSREETVYSHYSFWNFVSLVRDKPLWYYNIESFGLSSLSCHEPFRFPGELARCPALHTLILKDLDLVELPPEILSMRRLRILDISRNRVSSIPAGIGRLRQLVYFNAAENDLELLPEQLGRLRKLQILNLSGNRISTLGFSLEDLGDLKRLNLSGNCLDSPPRGLRSLNQLERLLLSYNELSAEEEALWEEAYSSQIPSYQLHFSF